MFEARQYPAGYRAESAGHRAGAYPNSIADGAGEVRASPDLISG